MYKSGGIELRYWDWKEKKMPQKTIWVSCSKCGEDYDEKKVKVLDIEEGLQGEDLLTFICPKGHRQTSRRRG